MITVKTKNTSVISEILGEWNIGKLTSDKTISLFGIKLLTRHSEEIYTADKELTKKKDNIGFNHKK